jgi:hypothetical protein
MSISAYLATVVTRAQELLGDRLVGVYPSGSVAFDAYRPGRSDVDLIAVADRPSPAEVATIAGALSHDALPCPATGLEFVLYDRTTLAALTTEAGFALNLNTGRELPPKAETDPGDGLTFWYPIDRDIVCQQRRVLIGPPFTELSPRQPYDVLLPVVAESVAAQLDEIIAHGDNAVLNGCRALRYHAERTWSAKPVAAAWALDHAPGFERVITAGLDSHARDRAAGGTVDVEPARTFLMFVLARCRS